MGGCLAARSLNNPGYAAIARQRAGDTAGARSDLEAFLDQPDVTRSSKQWAEEVLAGIPKPK